MESDNLFCVGSSFYSFTHFRSAFTSFENLTHSQFYNRDARTLTAAARLTPKTAEKAKTDLKTYYFIRYTCMTVSITVDSRKLTKIVYNVQNKNDDKCIGL